ncbi:hypothetical protein MAR_004782 [Mya arenaria]|uniref:Folate receptor-like domain-containing protein n=1 Tax=Mya arenaria TaxID=6604 RepID=A0ABY7EXK5_MYAAR|nr:uncharacterized protein LOC128202709 [Mya arenaria]WAR14677.1 hypothetical protein MAR_004782 [Mya arenaria]
MLGNPIMESIVNKSKMAWFQNIVLAFFTVVFSQLVNEIVSGQSVVEYSDDNKQCTYFEKNRYAKVEHGLSNCSWYIPETCCKRTEVTSVFSSNMMPLDHASLDCRNRMNYMMCFFCSPDQDQWYKDGKVHVCEDFCNSVYTECKPAHYDGHKIGDQYRNGTAFCEAQNFHVSRSNNCFKFNPSVFDSASLLKTPSVFKFWLIVLVFSVIKV